MPKKLYTVKLSNSEVIELFRIGKYTVNAEEGYVISSRSKEPLYTFTNGFKCRNYGNQKWIRLFSYPGYRALPVSHAIWMAVTQCPIPLDFQVHHRDLDPTNDAWINLVALHKDDHYKLHNNKEYTDTVPF